MNPPLQLRFLVSATDVARLPSTAAEIAFIGRSNVGKSSLVNALAGGKAEARVSKTPGRTQLINLFAEKGGGTLVDLPGYGYASVSKATRAGWSAMIEAYLLEREGLEMTMVLVDGEIGPTKLDLELLEWLRTIVVPHTVVATKADKVKSSARARRHNEVAAACRLEPGDVVWVSAAKGSGIDRLRELARLWLHVG
jgi:GTP-binding protein